MRFHGIDLLRIFAFLSISSYHLYSAIYWVEYDPVIWQGTFLSYWHWLPRFLSFSGFTIVAIFTFLFGFKGKQIADKKLYLIALAGIALLFFTYFDFRTGTANLEWDIYHYLLVCFVTVSLIARNQTVLFAFGFIGFALTLIPFWEFKIPGPLSQILVGGCTSDGKGGWFLLPWIGFPWAFLAYGRLVSYRPSLSNQELLLWVPFLAASLYFWGPFLRVPIGPDFYCFTFRQPPWVFWSHLIWVAFVFRLSVSPGIQSFLSKWAFLRWNSNLLLNRAFPLAYLIQLGLIWVAMQVADERQIGGWIFNSFLLGILPLTELLTRLVLCLRPSPAPKQ